MQTDDRGQTTQDFAIGISLFLVTVTFVFAFLPGLGSPLQQGVDAELREGADRIAASMVSDLSKPGEPNTLNATETKSFFENTDINDLKERFDIPDYIDVRIVIVQYDGTIVDYPTGSGQFELGSKYGGENTATARRVVEMDANGCRDGCILLVRVW